MANDTALKKALADGAPLAPFYAISSDELLLKDELLQAIRAAAKAQGFTQRLSMPLDGKTDWPAIHNACAAQSLFGDDNPLIELHLNGALLKADEAELLQLAEECASGALSHVMLVLTLPKLDNKKREAAWVQTIAQQSTWVEIASVTRAQLPQWIDQRLAEFGLSTDAETRNWIADQVEGNLFAAYQEVIKLSLLHPKGGQLTLEQAQHAILNVSQYNVFDMNSAILHQQPEKALRIVRGLRAEGEALPPILGMLTLLLNRVYALALARQAGENVAQKTRSLGIWSNESGAYQNLLSHFSMGQIMGLIQHAHHVDRIFKGRPVDGRLNDGWLEFESLVLKLTMPARSAAQPAYGAAR